MLDGTPGFTLQDVQPPLVHGVARMAGILYAGGHVGDLLDLIGPEPAALPDRAAWLMDRAWAAWLNMCPYQAAVLQDRALALAQVFRLHAMAGDVRLLALAAPDGLMVNAPLDFIAGPAGIALDIAFVRPGAGLPAVLPEHDVAIVAVSESGPDTLRQLEPVFGVWPRPILNDPARILPMSRTWLAHRLARLPGIMTAPAWKTDHATLAHGLSALPGATYPALLRPAGSHAGHGLVRLDGPDDLAAALAAAEDSLFTVTRFIDYRGPDGLYRKHRIAFVAGQPFLCHMAVSGHWMVHYLNAGMDRCAEKRAMEAAAMAGFDQFVQRHALALAGLVEAFGLDFFSIDCAEAPDGRLLVFEADTAAIIHSLDPPALYPYKRPAMQRCYDAFAAMLRSRRLPGPRAHP